MRDSDDTKLRELAYRLAQMAPDAPPFPEEPMVQLRPSPTTRPTPPRRRSPLVLVGLAAAAVLLIVGAPLLLDRLTTDEVTGPPPTVTPTTVVTPPTEPPPSTLAPAPAEPTNVSLYFVDDAGQLVPMGRVVDAAPSTPERVAASLTALATGPSSDDEALVTGLGTAVPAGSTLVTLAVEGGGVVVVTDATFATADLAGVAQVVYTATQFEEVDTVIFLTETSEPVVLADGTVLDQPLTRADFYGTNEEPGVLAPIFIDTPALNGVVGSPFTIRGVANVFEAQLGWEVVDQNGNLLADGFATATCGTGCWGDFSIDVTYTLDNVEVGWVVVYTTSPDDGSRMHEVRHLVTLEAAPSGDAVATPYEVFADVPGNPPLDGITVVTNLLTVYGSTAQGAELRVDGTVVPVSNGSFEAVVALEPGVNEILIEDVEFNGAYTVTYVPGGTVEFGYIDSFLEDGFVADYAEWLTGDEANQAAFEDGAIASVEEGVPNGFYIRNEDPALIDVPVGNELAIFLTTPALGSVTTVPVSVEEWIGLFQEDGTPWDPEAGEEPPERQPPHYGYFEAGGVGAPYWMTLDPSGFVLQLVQQYLP